jgi:hypothetical protein
MVKNAKPGVLSEALQGALGMSPGAPPPWLINMQRYGPPPSYTDLKVRHRGEPGLRLSQCLHWRCPPCEVAWRVLCCVHDRNAVETRLQHCKPPAVEAVETCS